MRADLHAHTTASDGQQSPEEVIRLATQALLDVIAITDHDTTAGISSAQLASNGLIEVIPGIEIGSRTRDDEIDILGYFIDPAHVGLQTRLDFFRRNRTERGQQIVERLWRLGLPVGWPSVLAFAGGDIVGRPHIAQAMVEAGHVASVKAAFELYLGSDKPGYIARETLSPEGAIELIHAAGGAAVLAHPVYVRDFPAVVERLAPAGLDGIEVNYPDHTPELQAQVRELAQQFGLIMTGGSDFHGLNMTGKAMLGTAVAPPGAVEALRERSLRYR
jgi:predicted metal-dependent phosphoesterase TrpH